MQNSCYIKKIAVLGAGVMGAQIAAQCVNAGFETYLFDLAGKTQDPLQPVLQAIAKLKQLKPSPLGHSQLADCIHACVYEEHLPILQGCDLVIEAIAERLDWKVALYQKIAPYLQAQAILVSNTSGLPMQQLAEVLPAALQARFLGAHFFNPPRYMHLLELIATSKTDASLLDEMETWFTRYLGKGVIRAKDTPNFIANRIGVFALLTSMHWAQKLGLGLDEVDALTGSLIGRAKSATFRTMDVVGLDTLAHVVATMQQQLTSDPWHAYFSLPSWLTTLIAQGHLGQKSGQGIYRKQQQTIAVYDVQTAAYRVAAGAVSPTVRAILSEPDPSLRMHKLMRCEDAQARFLTACFIDLFHYCAYHLQSIAHSVRDVDLAMRWGFGWQQGPFELWQAIGVVTMKDYMETSIQDKMTMSDAALPAWLQVSPAFYQDQTAYAPATQSYVPNSQLPVYQRQLIPVAVGQASGVRKQVIWANAALILWALSDDVGVLSFATKANSIGPALISGFHQALDIAEKSLAGVIIYQDDEHNFSAGANLVDVLSYVDKQQYAGVDALLASFQNLLLRIKYSPVPVVAALRGRALGGGCELLLHCARTVAAFESYPGLVEIGVGLIPAGGGCKEMAARATAGIPTAFEHIAKATVAASAIDAQAMHYLRADDCYVLHSNEVLYVAQMQIRMLQANNYVAPMAKSIKVAGREGRAHLLAGLVNWLEGGFISQHDYFIGSELAYVLTGGDLYQGTLVDEAWFLKLERDVFVRLLQTELSQARIKHLLSTGKPLRN